MLLTLTLAWLLLCCDALRRSPPRLRLQMKEVDVIKSTEGLCVFYTRIKEYGDNRMAKRAVRILKDMYDNGVDPTVTHYNAALWACEKSDMFTLVHTQPTLPPTRTPANPR